MKRKYLVVLEIVAEKIETAEVTTVDHRTVKDYIEKSLPLGIYNTKQRTYKAGDMNVLSIEVLSATKRKAEFE